MQKAEAKRFISNNQSQPIVEKLRTAWFGASIFFGRKLQASRRFQEVLRNRFKAVTSFPLKKIENAVPDSKTGRD